MTTPFRRTTIAAAVAGVALALAAGPAFSAAFALQENSGSGLGNAFAGGYSDEAGFGVTSAVDQSTYGGNKPNISRRLFKGYNAVKTFYNDSSSSGSELYVTAEQFAAIRSEIRDEIQADRNGYDLGSHLVCPQDQRLALVSCYL
jgi:hypothetical protein